eukprot:SAG22_NODE_5371_length_1026_cov_2.008630_2_plen_148_part_00
MHAWARPHLQLRRRLQQGGNLLPRLLPVRAGLRLHPLLVGRHRGLGLGLQLLEAARHLPRRRAQPLVGRLPPLRLCGRGRRRPSLCDLLVGQRRRLGVVDLPGQRQLLVLLRKRVGLGLQVRELAAHLPRQCGHLALGRRRHLLGRD